MIPGLSPEDKLNLNLMKDKFEYFDIVPYEYIKKKPHLQFCVRVNGEKLN